MSMPRSIPRKSSLLFMLFSALMPALVSADLESSDYARPCKITMAFSYPMIIAGWKDEGVSKTEAIAYYQESIEASDKKISEDEKARELAQIEDIYGKFGSLSAEQISAMMINQCIIEAERTGKIP